VKTHCPKAMLVQRIGLVAGGEFEIPLTERPLIQIAVAQSLTKV